LHIYTNFSACTVASPRQGLTSSSPGVPKQPTPAPTPAPTTSEKSSKNSKRRGSNVGGDNDEHPPKPKGVPQKEKGKCTTYLRLQIVGGRGFDRKNAISLINADNILTVRLTAKGESQIFISMLDLRDNRERKLFNTGKVTKSANPTWNEAFQM